MEAQARVYFQEGNWTAALDIYNKLLQNKNINQENISLFLNHIMCLYNLKEYEIVINECRQILKSSSCDSKYKFRIRLVLVRSLFNLKRFGAIEVVVKDWLLSIKQADDFGDSKLILERFLESYFSLRDSEHLIPWTDNLELKFTELISSNKFYKRSSKYVCIYCNVSFNDRTSLKIHCSTPEHETIIMSDEGHDWKWRAPPRGLKSDSYTICENWKEKGTCQLGSQCIEAHGEAELQEWRERFQYREMKIVKARERELYGKSYTENLLEKWSEATNSTAVMRDEISDVDVYSSFPLSTTVFSKNSHYFWKFTLSTKKPLKAVSLLRDTYRSHFCLKEISMENQQFDIKDNQEFINCSPVEHEMNVEYQVVIFFKTSIFGTFRQSVVFDFGSEPVLVKHLCVEVIPDCDYGKLEEIRKEVSFSMSERWTNENSQVVPFSPGFNTEWSRMLKSLYPEPHAKSFVLSHTAVVEKKFTINNYRERMHELLQVEEVARCGLISKYNLTTKLQIANRYLLIANSTSTAKYSANGELFAIIQLGKDLSEDTSEGRLITMHSKSVLLLPSPSEEVQIRKVYEAIIEDKTKNVIYLRLSAETVEDLKLTNNTYLEAQIQFQLNRLPYCEWHFTVDNIRNLKLIFPDIYNEPVIPWSSSKQWSSRLDSRLNSKQKEAVIAITTLTSIRLPPILVIGPFGTGKTFTLAQGVKQLIEDENNKILLCTHSNSAADLYIKEYFDPWVEAGNENARPLRIYYQKRWISTVSSVVQKYCCIKQNGNTREFQIPTPEEIKGHKIIIATLSTSIYLSAMNLPSGTFTHVIIDEAAQALECETVTPLIMADENTRVVLAGDHMQLGPVVFSDFARERNLQTSLLERLHELYPTQFSCKIMLCENYRAHRTIVDFASESFYNHKLLSSTKQPEHFKFYPLTFFTTRGEDVQDTNSTGFYNNSEVYEVVERVIELQRNWPIDWGEFHDQCIGVLTPYSDQVFRIRSELRKRGINVCVERVLNVQGKQFRVIILSTVRTRNTCGNDKTDVNYGFLSNSKLLNTAITRAQSLVAVVGDPVALCSVGRCSKVWERFIQICHENTSLYGITWPQLKFQLDGIELKKIFTLNPLAPEFIPRRYRERRQTRTHTRTVTQEYPGAVGELAPRNYRDALEETGSYREARLNEPIQTPQLGAVGSTSFAPSMPFVFQVMTPPTASVPNLPQLMVNNSSQIPVIPPNHILDNTKSLPTPNTQMIQFMNNVHFPEAQQLRHGVSLLPQNMSLAEMKSQPLKFKEAWCNYLRNQLHVNPEVVEKFEYLIQLKGLPPPPPPDVLISCARYERPLSEVNLHRQVYIREANWNSNGLESNLFNPLYNRTSNLLNQQRINGVAENRTDEEEMRNRINEEFARLNTASSSIEGWYETLSSCLSIHRNYDPGEPRFYKYYQ